MQSSASPYLHRFLAPSVLIAFLLATAFVPQSSLAADASGKGLTPLSWKTLPPIPDSAGFAGSFAGVSNGALIIAGGANFPENARADGGTKVWHDRVFILEDPAGSWKQGFSLPRPTGYGVSVTLKEGLLCIGGSDAQRHYADVFQIAWNNGQLITTTPYPKLPFSLAGACGARLGDTIYLVGGSESPESATALNRFLALDLKHPAKGWQTLPPLPGKGRLQSIAGVQDGAFHVFGGLALSPGDAAGKPVREPLADGYRYSPLENRWRRIADLPHPVNGATSPAAAIGPAHLLLFGSEQRILAYHTVTNTWTAAGDTPVPCGSSTLVQWKDGWVVPGGEVRPGIVTNDVQFATARDEKTSFGWLNLLTLSTYPAIMLGIGLYFAGKKRKADDFFRGGQRIPAWAAGLSIYATMLSSITFMSVPAKAYASDWGMVLNYVSIILLAPVIIIFYLPFFRQLDVTTAYEYLERRFNLAARLLGSASFILFQIARTGIVLFLPALALSTVSSLDITLCIVGMSVLTILLTVFGGMEAVIWTDVAQSIILLGAAVLSLAIILPRLDGSLAQSISIANSDGKFFSNVSWSLDMTIATGWVLFLGNAFTNLISYTSNQEVVQRYLTTPDEKKAGRAIWINALVSIPSGLLFFAVGTALYLFYKQQPAALDPAMNRLDAIFPFFMVHEMPAGVAGFVVAGIFAAAQPTSGLNSVATTFVTDFYRRFSNHVTDRDALRAGRIVTVVTGLLGMTVALIMVRYPTGSLWELFISMLGLTTGILAGLFALGMFTRRANGAGAIVGIVITAGLLCWVLLKSRINPLMYGCFSVVSCFISGYLASVVFPGNRQALDGLTVFTRGPRDDSTT